jgi:predicted RNA-binding protein
MLLKSAHIPRNYILVGDEKTWKVALYNEQWGFTQKNIGLWNTINEGERVAFYVTSPVKKIIGFAVINEKFVSKEILWPDEKLFNKSIWENRVKFKIKMLVKNWSDGVDPPPNTMLNVGRKVIKKKIFDDLIKKGKRKWDHHS